MGGWGNKKARQMSAAPGFRDPIVGDSARVCLEG